MSKVTEKVIEFQGQQVVVQKRQQGEVVDYSLDGGLSWHETMAGAYEVANTAGHLCREVPAAEDGAGEDTQAFLLAFVQELQKLEVGDSLKVYRGEGMYAVTREETVLVTRASTITDIDFRMEEPSGTARQG